MLTKELGQISLIHILKDEVEWQFLRAHPVEFDDVGMIELQHDLGFTGEVLECFLAVIFERFHCDHCLLFVIEEVDNLSLEDNAKVTLSDLTYVLDVGLRHLTVELLEFLYRHGQLVLWERDIVVVFNHLHVRRILLDMLEAEGEGRGSGSCLLHLVVATADHGHQNRHHDNEDTDCEHHGDDLLIQIASWRCRTRTSITRWDI